MEKSKILLKFLLMPITLLLSQFVQASPSDIAPDTQNYKGGLRYLPNFSEVYMPDCLPYESVKVTVNLVVDTKGNVIKTALARSSGDRKTDTSVMIEVRHAKFYPFQKDGKPVIANVPLTVSMECPPPPSPAEIEDQKKQAILHQEILRQLGSSNNSSNNSTIK